MKIPHYSLLAAASLFVSIIASSVSFADSIPTQGDWTMTLKPRNLEGNLNGPTDAYYDTSLNITWLANANAVAGSPYDPGSAGLNWLSANAWAAWLDINGITGWTLPTITPTIPTCTTFSYSGTDCGYNVNTANSEMAHLFFVTLENKSYFDTSGNPQDGWGLTNTGPFSNLQQGYYWSASTIAPGPGDGVPWAFLFAGVQTNGYEYEPYGMQAWAVHAGDVGVAVSSVPLPTAAWLLVSGLLGLTGVMRRKAA